MLIKVLMKHLSKLDLCQYYQTMLLLFSFWILLFKVAEGFTSVPLPSVFFLMLSRVLVCYQLWHQIIKQCAAVMFLFYFIFF